AAFVSQIATSLLAYLSLFYLLIRFKANHLYAIFLAFCFLFCQAQLHVFPKICLFQFSLICICLGLSNHKDFNLIKWLAVLLVLSLLMYTRRPEFTLAVFLASILMTVYVVLTNTQKFVRISAIWIAVILVAVFGYFLGGVFPHGQIKNEFIMAFYDNYYVWTGKHFDFADEFKNFPKIYGAVQYDWEILWANPKVLLHHILSNVPIAIKSLLMWIKSVFYDDFALIFGTKGKFVFAASLVLFLFTIRIRKDVKTGIFKGTWILFAILLLSASILVFVIYPLPIYTILLLPFLFVLLSKGSEYFTLKYKNRGLGVLAVCMVVKLWNFCARELPSSSHVNFYTKMASIDTKGNQLKVLSNDVFGFQFYDKIGKRIAYDPYKQALDKTISETKPDIILLYAMDLEVPNNRDFIVNKKSMDSYVRIPTFESIQRYIWVKKGLRLPL
ncbi:MAG: hypothetical protein ACRCVT_14800, partial [Leadbetterella sp.]